MCDNFEFYGSFVCHDLTGALFSTLAPFDDSVAYTECEIGIHHSQRNAALQRVEKMGEQDTHLFKN